MCYLGHVPGSVEHVALDLGVIISSPVLGIEPILKN